MLCIAICDDDKSVLLQMKEYVKKYKGESNQNIKLCLYQSGEDLIKNFKKNFDIIILDIQMTGMNGIQVAYEIRKFDNNVIIIILTSIIKYVLEGYKVNAKNYLMKPLTYKRFKEEIDNALLKIDKNNQYMLVKNDLGKYKIYLNQILYIETYQRNTKIHRERDSVICYKTMREHEEYLKDVNFYRCHTSYIVNLSFVCDVTSHEILLISQDIIPLSKSRKRGFTDQWLRYLGDEI